MSRIGQVFRLGFLDTRYLVKAGITGGQTAIGGTAITDILKLQGTSGNGTLTSAAIQMLVGNNGATTALTVLNNGNVGIGTTSPGSKLDISGTANGTDAVLSVRNTTGTGRGLFIDSASTTNVAFLVQTPLSTDLTTGKVFTGSMSGDAYGRFMFYSDGKYGVGPGTADRDIFLSRSATNTFKISSDAGTGLGNLIVTGNVGIGLTSPTAVLHLKAGTATASTAPFKLTTGISNTTAELGAIEFTDPQLFFSVTDTTVKRKGFLFDDGTALTTRQLPYATASGRLAGQTPVADGTYTVGSKITPVTGQDGTITILNGVITAIQQAT